MNPKELHHQMEQARERIRDLQHELSETQRGLLAMTMELEQRVEQRTASLQASEAQLHTTLENLSEGVVVSDATGNILHWNRAGLSMHGFTSLEEGLRAVAAFADTFELSTLEGSALVVEQWPLCRILRGDVLRDWELRVRHLREGWRRIFSYSGSMVCDADGRPLLAVLSINDVTERREAEEQARLRAAALEAAANGIAITDSEGRILWVNQAFCDLTGYAREEVVGQSHRLLKSGKQNETFYRELWETIRRGEVWHGELVNRRKDGSEYVEDMSVAPLRNGKGAIINFIAVKRDVSERKAQEEALATAKLSAESAKARADEANRAKDQFLAVLSHELRTPLTPVVAAVSMLQDGVEDEQNARDALEIIRRNVEMEARLIDDLLDVTRIVRGKIELHRRPTMLCEVIRQAVEVCRPDIEARQIHFGVDLGGCAPYLIDADPARLQQVFWNLLKNAVKFTPHGGCISIHCTRKDGHVIAEVIDNGEGIEPRLLPHIFNAFEQGGARITRQFGGLGLGLTITKGVVELHGGTVEAYSAGKGKGAIFRVRLPLCVGYEPEPVRSTPAEAEGQSQLASVPVRVQRLRILLVEDHGDTATVMKRLLLARGYAVETAGDVATALDLATHEHFDLLLSDLGLPDGSGVDLMRKLREHGLAMPGIALSGYGQEEDIRRSKEAGFSAHLTKPTSPDVLTRTIGTVIDAGAG